MKKLILSMFLCLLLVGLVSAGSEQVVNETAIDSLFDNPEYSNGIWMNGTWNGVWQIAQPWGFKKGDIVFKEDFTSEELEYFYYTRYFDDPVIEKPSKPDGSACITEWVCENGDWVKADWMHPKRVESCITNYNEKNCAVSERYWNRIIPGKYCVVLNDNGIGLKSKPTTACQSETIVLNEPKSTEKIDIIIEKPKPKSLWQRIISWFK